MSHQQKTVILAEHTIKTRVFNGKLQAEDFYSIQRNGIYRSVRRWADVTTMTRSQLYQWLGY